MRCFRGVLGHLDPIVFHEKKFLQFWIIYKFVINRIITQSPFSGRYPMADSVAPTTPLTLLHIHSITLMLSPKPGHMNLPWEERGVTNGCLRIKWNIMTNCHQNHQQPSSCPWHLQCYNAKELKDLRYSTNIPWVERGVNENPNYKY